jgi:hypothetical protein
MLSQEQRKEQRGRRGISDRKKKKKRDTAPGGCSAPPTSVLGLTRIYGAR